MIVITYNLFDIPQVVLNGTPIEHASVLVREDGSLMYEFDIPTKVTGTFKLYGDYKAGNEGYDYGWMCKD